jgi:hypothetical protein
MMEGLVIFTVLWRLFMFVMLLLCWIELTKIREKL